MTDTKPTSRRVQLKWVIPPDMVGVYANHMTVQHTEGEFIITFYQAKPPIGLLPEDIAALEEIEVHAITQVIVPATSMPAFVRALVENLKRHNETVWHEAEEEG